MRVILMRFDAPLVSFGAPMVDQNGVVQLFPALSMLTGLFANALGWDHRDALRLDELQERIRFAARIDRRGEPLIDYQTVDLGQPWMDPEKAGWTTRGKIASRGGDKKNAEGTHIRFRHYRADSLHTVAVTIEGAESPTIDHIAVSLKEPARPLFIGRKCCLPSAPILLGVVEATSAMDALARHPRDGRSDPGPLSAWWWEGHDNTGSLGESVVLPVTDERDWANQIHVGRRLMRQGLIDPPEKSHAS